MTTKCLQCGREFTEEKDYNPKTHCQHDEGRKVCWDCELEVREEKDEEWTDERVVDGVVVIGNEDSNQWWFFNPKTTLWDNITEQSCPYCGRVWWETPYGRALEGVKCDMKSCKTPAQVEEDKKWREKMEKATYMTSVNGKMVEMTREEFDEMWNSKLDEEPKKDYSKHEKEWEEMWASLKEE